MYWNVVHVLICTSFRSSRHWIPLDKSRLASRFGCLCQRCSMAGGGFDDVEEDKGDLWQMSNLTREIVSFCCFLNGMQKGSCSYLTLIWSSRCNALCNFYGNFQGIVALWWCEKLAKHVYFWSVLWVIIGDRYVQNIWKLTEWVPGIDSFVNTADCVYSKFARHWKVIRLPAPQNR